MIPHGFAKDNKDAALKAIIAGSDMDMESRSYINHLRFSKRRKIDIKFIDDAVRRILTKKYELGLFENPYKFCDENAKKTNQQP